jgi:hypothetical protein
VARYLEVKGKKDLKRVVAAWEPGSSLCLVGVVDPLPTMVQLCCIHMLQMKLGFNKWEIIEDKEMQPCQYLPVRSVGKEATDSFVELFLNASLPTLQLLFLQW